MEKLEIQSAGVAKEDCRIFFHWPVQIFPIGSTKINHQKKTVTDEQLDHYCNGGNTFLSNATTQPKIPLKTCKKNFPSFFLRIDAVFKKISLIYVSIFLYLILIITFSANILENAEILT